MSKPVDSVLKSRIWLIALFLAFAGPLILASILYILRDTVELPSASAYGELVTPARPITQLSASGGADNESLNSEDIQGHWTLLYLGDTHCDLDCEAGLFKLRQVRLTLGRERGRVQRLYLYSGKEPDTHLKSILQGHPQMRVARLCEPLEVLDGLPKTGIYVIDPLGNLMMHYDSNATSKGIKKDMKRLLRISRIG